MQPTREWLEKWKKVKDKLQAPRNLEDYFTLKENCRRKIRCFKYRNLFYS